jgi:flagella basal body P-ring formation protein FlgA
VHLDAYNTGAMQPVSVRYDARSARFDVTFEIGNDVNAAPTRLRFTGSAVETVEAAVLTRNVERADMLKSSDIIVERRPKLEIGGDAAVRGSALGMQMRHSMRAGQALRVADIAKPDLVQKDQGVTMIYQSDGLYLTTRGKAIDNGSEGDTVSVLNVQSKRTLSGVVTGRGQVTIQGASQSAPMAPATEQTSSRQHDETPAPVALAQSLVQAPASPIQVSQAQISQAQARPAQTRSE